MTSKKVNTTQKKLIETTEIEEDTEIEETIVDMPISQVKNLVDQLNAYDEKNENLILENSKLAYKYNDAQNIIKELCETNISKQKQLENYKKRKQLKDTDLKLYNIDPNKKKNFEVKQSASIKEAQKESLDLRNRVQNFLRNGKEF